MSGSNAISGITIVGALLALNVGESPAAKWLGFAAVVLATINVVGGYVVTDRMLAMFRKKGGPKDMNAVLINLLYIVSSILFIFGIKMLGSADTARRGNRLSSVGMLMAVVATLLYLGLDWWMVAGGIALGSVIGIVAAYRVQMTAMPEMVALFNGFGGLASLLVGAAEYVKLRDNGMSHYLKLLEAQSGVTVPGWFVLVAIGLTILIGGVTFTGSRRRLWQACRREFPARPRFSPARS